MIVDTSVWIDYFADRERWQVDRLDEEITAKRPVALTDVVYTEILQGLRDDSDLLAIERQVLKFPVLRLAGLADFRQAAQLHRTVQRHGHTIRRTSDCLIAAVCVREGRPLLHSDRDFDRLSACTPLASVEADD